jgi:primase-polymerase (primpol)-like protein
MNTNTATQIEKISLTIAFSVNNTVYYGPDNDFSQIERKNLREKVYVPQYENHRDYIFSADVIADNSHELIKYYRDVLRILKKHGKSLKGTTYFWIRPLIYFGDNTIGFPWHDYYENSNSFLQMILSDKNGELFDDIDQGWALSITADENNLYLKETNGEFDNNEEIFTHIKTSKKHLQEQASILIKQLDIIMEQLVSEFQENYWSSNCK